MRALRKLPALALVVASVGCDPVFLLRGEVVTAAETPASDAKVYERQAPIPFATYSVYCGDHLDQSDRADRHGRIEWITLVGPLGRDCRIVVEKQGYAPQVISLAQLCNPDCGSLFITAELVPLSQPDAGTDGARP